MEAQTFGTQALPKPEGSTRLAVNGGFFAPHWQTIKREGPPAFARKSLRGLGLLATFPLYLVARLALRASRPFVRIRLGPLHSQAIGHLVLDPELYLAERVLDPPPPRELDVFFHDEPLSNRLVDRMLRRRLRVLPLGRLGISFGWWTRQWPLPEPHRVSFFRPIRSATDPKALRGYDSKGVLARTPAQLAFTKREMEKGRRMMRELGIPDQAPFVCLFQRDLAYFKHRFARVDYTHTEHRSSSIENFALAAIELARRGYYVLRMGAKVAQPLPVEHPQVIDYAWRHRTDFLDIFLPAHCRFYIGDSSGYACVPEIFRRPIALTNFVSLSKPNISGPDDIFIPKKIWSTAAGRYLRADERLGFVGLAWKAPDLARHGLEVEENSPEEIRDHAIEMDERLNGTWRKQPGDEELQRAYWSAYKQPVWEPTAMPNPIGTSYLRRNQWFVDSRASQPRSRPTQASAYS